MKKNAVVYDKWLRSLGGGEVVACNIAKILADNGYEVTFIAGKKVDKEIIKNKLSIDLSKVSMVEVWTDEAKVKQLSKDKDLFINTSFLDYTYGIAKKNIYYTHFPKEPYNTIGEMLFTKFLFPLVVNFINPFEMFSDLEMTTVIKTVEDSEPAYLLKENNKVAISYLQKNKIHVIEFSLFLSSFSQSLMRDIKIYFEEANIRSREVFIDHNHNQINFRFKIKALSSTAYLGIEILKSQLAVKDDQVYLLYPKIKIRNVYESVFKVIYNKINNKLRSGVFSNPLERLGSYQLILANSSFTQKWIKNYWKRESTILYPPVELLFHKYNLDNQKKKKWICSVGRFFMLGHGKKQEILIKAFKKFYDLGNNDWELHLCGGISTEESSLDFLERLKSEVNGYPVYFHLNVSRSEIERILLNSKIYWHATGFGENEDTSPIKFEHFGIAPIEAMSAKCIPILFDGGGLRETIYKAGFNERNLFKSINELVENTIYHIDHAGELDWTGIFSRIDSEFSLDAFRKKFLSILQEK
ncbi:MAG: glycosyltransferase [Microgenomates group bacterium]|jgi:glycosyltransferase involved in cell wall biosynthesis